MTSEPTSSKVTPT